MVDDFHIIQTADGTDTLYSVSLDESYHSKKGAVQESTHVYLEAGVRALEAKTLRVFEVGFGTGLNTLLTWQEADLKNRQIRYDAIEAYPLSRSCYQLLQFNLPNDSLPSDALIRLHELEWNVEHVLTPQFTFKKYRGDFTAFSFDTVYDVVFYDAFAPDKQPELWTDDLMATVYNALKPGGLLVTYCAKGAVRRSMQRAGFTVERLPGPLGKREMLRAVR